MFADSALRIELHQKGTVRVLEVQADRALVGSGAHCDLRLAPDEAAVEQLVIEARDDEVYAKVQALDPPCRLNGAPFLEGRLPADSLLELSGVGLRVTLTELKEAKKSNSSAGSSQTHPAVQGFGLMFVGVGLFMMLRGGEEAPGILYQAVEPPVLFAEAEVRCPQTDADAARALAEQESYDADSKAERAPFYPGDGLEAVTLFERSAACFAQTGEHGRAEGLRDRASVLKRVLKDELHVRHVRLERLLGQQKFEEGARELELVLSFMADKQSPYALWLMDVKRELKVKNDLQPQLGG